jgi:hypothetical protein
MLFHLSVQLLRRGPGYWHGDTYMHDLLGRKRYKIKNHVEQHFSFLPLVIDQALPRTGFLCRSMTTCRPSFLDYPYIFCSHVRTYGQYVQAEGRLISVVGVILKI